MNRSGRYSGRQGHDLGPEMWLRAMLATQDAKRVEFMDDTVSWPSTETEAEAIGIGGSVAGKLRG